VAKEIIIAGVDEQSSPGTLTVSGWFWFPITSGIKTQTNGSAWSGASAAENTAIQNGTVQEVAFARSYPAGLPTANIKADLQQAWGNKNAQIGGVGPAQFANVFFDSSTGWSA
jgi:hypothetical protein